LTIKKYQEIRQILKDDGGELNIQANIIACLTDMDLDAVLNLSLTKYNDLVQKTAFLMNKPEISNHVPSRIVINGKEYVLCKNVNKLTASQYIDYQNYIASEDNEKYLANIIACFLIPKGFKYADGYDVLEVANEISEHLSIQEAMNICFFFRRKYLNSIKYTLTYLELRMKMMRLKTKNQEAKEKMKIVNQKIAEYRRALENVGAGW
jgi:hypothetical protein